MDMQNGPKETIEAPLRGQESTSSSFNPRKLRKTLGSGMRQIGILYAAAFVALHENVANLDTDHKIAKILADGKMRPLQLDYLCLFLELVVHMKQLQKKFPVSNDEVETKQSDSSQIRKEHKKTKKTRKKSRDMDTHNLNASENLESGCSCNQNREQKTKSNFGIDVIREEVSCQIHQKYINCVNHDVNGEAPAKSNYKHSDSEELCVAIKEFMNQMFPDGKHLTEDQKIHHYRELMDALEVISSDEELFLKLLRDTNSLLPKYVQNLQDAQIEKDEESKSFAESKLSEQKLGDLKQSEKLVICKHHYFSGERSSLREKNPMKANEKSEASKRIVILKPGPPGLQNSETENSPSPESHYIARNKGTTERVGSHFFLSEIKRKLKNAMGKQQHGASTVGILNGYERQSLEDSDRGVGNEKVGSSPGKEHFYIERIAKPPSGIKIGKVKESEIHLEHENHGILDQRYNISPCGSSGRDMEHGFVTARMRLSAYDKVWKANENTWSPKQEKNVSPLGQVAPNLESLPSVSDSNPDYKVQPPNSIPSISDNLIHDNEVEETHPTMVDEMNPEGDMEIKKENEENPVQSSSLASLSSSSTTKHFEDLESAINIAERPSPVSVLEPLFIDDDISPSKTISRRVYWHLLPLPFPRTLDQIVTKDMSRTGTWMDRQFDIETIGVDMGEAILQEFMEDTILSYVNGSPKSENALVIAEPNEKDGILNL
ncbi:hypothetical protein ACE6H2_001757 [Prunus campanulata]